MPTSRNNFLGSLLNRRWLVEAKKRALCTRLTPSDKACVGTAATYLKEAETISALLHVGFLANGAVVR